MRLYLSQSIFKIENISAKNGAQTVLEKSVHLKTLFSATYQTTYQGNLKKLVRSGLKRVWNDKQNVPTYSFVTQTI
jgi:hypothetical protein